jgi:hypothetical protein
LPGELGCVVKYLIPSLSIDEIEEGKELDDSLPVHLGCEELVSVLNLLHLGIESFIVADDSDTTICTRLNLDSAKAEHSQGHTWCSIPLGPYK